MLNPRASGGPAASLARTLVLAYVLLITYASVYPLTEWHDSGAPLTAFLTAAWPRYYSAFDIWINVAAYVPLGLLAVPALQPPLSARHAAALAVVLGAALSFGMETAQHFIPSRVPSNLDLGANTLGALIGAGLGLRYRAMFVGGGGLDRWRRRRFVRGRAGDLGLTLLALWLLTQLNPEGLVLGTGDLRSMLGVAAPVAFSAERHQALETLVAACGLISAGLICREIQREFSGWLIATLLLMALATKALAWAVLAGPEEFMRWLTPGTRIGLLIGVAALLPALWLPASGRVAVAALTLLATTALVNLAPENPYSAQILARWYQGHFFNFNGLARLIASSWPFLALAYLVGGSNSPQ